MCFFFFFLSYEITVYCFSSCHREYVPVAGHGAWLAVLLLLLLSPFVIFDRDNPLISCPLCKSKTLWNIFMILGR